MNQLAGIFMGLGGWILVGLYVRRGRIIRHQANEILVLGAELDDLDEQVEWNRAAYDWEEDGSW